MGNKLMKAEYVVEEEDNVLDGFNLTQEVEEEEKTENEKEKNGKEKKKKKKSKKNKKGQKVSPESQGEPTKQENGSGNPQNDSPIVLNPEDLPEFDAEHSNIAGDLPEFNAEHSKIAGELPEFNAEHSNIAGALPGSNAQHSQIAREAPGFNAGQSDFGWMHNQQPMPGGENVEFENPVFQNFQNSQIQTISEVDVGDLEENRRYAALGVSKEVLYPPPEAPGHPNVPPLDDKKGLESFMAWVMNGNATDIDRCENVMFEEK